MQEKQVIMFQAAKPLELYGGQVQPGNWHNLIVHVHQYDSDEE